jgi:hypothetical protein
MDEEFGLIQKTGGEISKTSINSLLDSVRPVWKGKGLLKRVERLLQVDPSSACQRLLSASIFDLREKIVTVGIDIAKEVAKIYKLPPIEKDEDILENYSTTNIIDLSYRIGILQRTEWRRIQRCYEIRKDLEHEDNEYEAVLEDCFYIFKSTIEVILSKDPIELLKITDVKQIIEEPSRITITEELINNFEHAPELRQREIISFLISTIYNEEQPDIIRENAFELLMHFKTKTKTACVIEVAKILENKIGKKPIDLVTARIGHAIGATAYFKKIKIKDFYHSLLLQFKSVTKWSEQAKVVGTFNDIGHFTYCPPDLIPLFTEYLVNWYIGEPGGYGTWGQNRKVFYSDKAAPIILRIFEYAEVKLNVELENLREDKDTKDKLQNRYILDRFEKLCDTIDRIKND